MNILRSLFRGVDFDDPAQKCATPNPHLLLNENIVANLISGKSVGQAVTDNSQQGRGKICKYMYVYMKFGICMNFLRLLKDFLILEKLRKIRIFIKQFESVHKLWVEIYKYVKILASLKFLYLKF